MDNQNGGNSKNGLIAQTEVGENGTQINFVAYDRNDGTRDHVAQVTVNGVEVGHTTSHPDGTVNVHTGPKNDQSKTTYNQYGD